MSSGGHAAIGNEAAPRALFPADVKHRSRHALAMVRHTINALDVRATVPLVLEIPERRLALDGIGNGCGRTSTIGLNNIYSYIVIIS